MWFFDGLTCFVSRILNSFKLLWTDPQDAPGRGPSKRVRIL